MIALKSPITISPAPVNGKPIQPITLNNIDLIVRYDDKSASAMIKGTGATLTLWDSTTTPTYAQAGQFTDTDVNNRVMELLGSDIAASIKALYPQPSTPPAGSPARQTPKR